MNTASGWPQAGALDKHSPCLGMRWSWLFATQ
jgi:hypothetical protein